MGSRDLFGSDSLFRTPSSRGQGSLAGPRLDVDYKGRHVGVGDGATRGTTLPEPTFPLRPEIEYLDSLLCSASLRSRSEPPPPPSDSPWRHFRPLKDLFLWSTVGTPSVLRTSACREEEDDGVGDRRALFMAFAPAPAPYRSLAVPDLREVWVGLSLYPGRTQNP